MVLSFVAAGSCTNDFDRFDYSGIGAQYARAGTSGTFGTVASGGSTPSGGGTGGTSSIAAGGSTAGSTTSAGGKGGTAGTAGTTATRGGTGGSTGGGPGSGGGANAGSGAAGESGAPGMAGAPACDASLSDSTESCGACERACATSGVAELGCEAGVCSSSCVIGYANCSMPARGADDGCETETLGDPNNCGGCDNDCTAQGLGACVGGLCGCASSAECGNGSASVCVQDHCECDGSACRPGERCRQVGGNRLCACNGGAACGPTEACCNVPAGCVDIESSPDHCGACGHACVTGFTCAAGLCACDSDDDCDAGLPVSVAAGGAGAGGEAGAATGGSLCVGGTCVCGSLVCGVGERCRADGSCG